MSHDRKVAVIGLGYVGLPVAVHMALEGKVIAFDINSKRIEDLKKGVDITHEVSAKELQNSNLTFTSNIEDLRKADFYIVAVPTPIDEAKRPDLSPMLSASEIVGRALKKGDIVVYESTVFPGACEECCLPILENISKLKGGIDFKIGYSPERINPGDKDRSFSKITKIISAEDEETLNVLESVYGAVVKAGVYKAESIKVAEAAKVIENIQRDINIALMNELAIVLDLMGIDTKQVLKAAGTKWNFLNFTPGLVGGHCIGVDPYYLTHKAQTYGYDPEVILSGRKINDSMAEFIVQRTIKLMIKADINIKHANVGVLGLTFKEQCPDTRNSKVTDIIDSLIDYETDVEVFDPCVNVETLPGYIMERFRPMEDLKNLDVIILAVSHQHFINYKPSDYLKHLKKGGVFIDIKGIYSPKDFSELDVYYWRL